ncbi:E3 ubiquitin protein ligase DRIP2-like [Cornus florida]|uniref:E3 ubiquitin protein ligase DRIP2-like n=1 Tax=Cornus florida TaxID=4283 RepID=UPI00289947C4|nr:E3 ubiquitin protein ligase DRIP2-like [Cornus florida]
MDQGKSVLKPQATDSSIKSQDSVKVESETIVDLLTCVICNKIFKEATTINICLHTFCKNCIYQKFQEEESKCCPLCNKDLGSSLEQFLRADEKLNNIARTIFPPSNSRKNNARSATSKLKNKSPEVTNACATRTEAVPQDICTLQKTTRKFHDGSRVAGMKGHLDRTSSHDIYDYLSTVSKEKQISTMMPKFTCHRNNVTSATSKLKNNRSEVTNACATGTEAVHQEKFLDGRRAAGMRGHLDRRSSHDIYDYLSTVSKEKQNFTMMPDITCMSERNTHKNFSEAETKSKVQRKKRTTRGRGRSSSYGQKKNKEKIEHKNVKISSDGAYGIMDSGESHDKTSSEEEHSDKGKIQTIWLHLFPRADE